MISNSFCFTDKYIFLKFLVIMWLDFRSSWTLCINCSKNNDEALICRTCIIVRTITLQLALDTIKRAHHCKRIEVSGIVKTVFRASPGATFSRSLCLASCTQPHPIQSQLVSCVVFLGNWNTDFSSSPRAPCPQWAEDYRSWLLKRLSKS